ncbi:hypothetical protein WJX73_007310 [Symbiochloris irregularis]|uniref:Uncharacterized protein n=1 Tax=Symbiochloris irregularis TaxID=706552 RepID=A0AAW1P0G3_9CHLO
MMGKQHFGRRSVVGPRKPLTSTPTLADVKYGVKLEAVALLQEWVRDIGSQAGLQSSPENARIFSGSVGVPESRLELEVEFETLTDVESFWGSIPPAAHKAWSQRMQHYILDGSPTWHIYRTVPSFPEQDESSPSQQPRAESAPSTSAPIAWPQFAAEPQDKDTVPEAPKTAADILAMMERGQDINIGNNNVGQVWTPDAHVALDWKGDPMKINPGDNIPGL